MRTLREHKDSVMAVLEAFVYDPLLNWRLMDSGMYSLRMRTFIKGIAIKVTKFKALLNCAIFSATCLAVVL